MGLSRRAYARHRDDTEFAALRRNILATLGLTK